MITSGIYAPFWYYNRRKEFEALGTEKKLNKNLTIIYIILPILMILIYFVLFCFLTYFGDLTSVIIPITILLVIIGMLIIVFSIILAFGTRKIINQAWEAKGVKRKVSGFFTFIFNFLYLQYEINRTIDNKEMEKRIGPWICFILSLTLPILVALVIGLILGAVVIGFSSSFKLV